MAASSADRLYERLVTHLEQLNSGATIDVRLFEEAELILPDALADSDEALLRRVSLMRLLAFFVDTTSSDPVPAINLLTKLFHGFTWSQIYQFATEHSIPFRTGLQPNAEAAPYNHVIITLLGKAAKNPVDAAHLASIMEPDPIIRCLVECWLQTPDVGVAAAAQNLLLDLLIVDREIPNPIDSSGSPSGGQGLVWKRVFGDRDVYAAFFNSCALKSPLNLSKTQRTLAQARLMEWLPLVSNLDWQSVSQSHHRDIEQEAGVKGGLLDFAALIMVDYQNDVLMHRCLIDFYTALLNITRPSDEQTLIQEPSLPLQYLIQHGIHVRTATIYLQLHETQLDPVDVMFLYGPAANYVATYAQQSADHFLSSTMPKQIIGRLKAALTSSQRESPKYDLHVLASIPRQTLLIDGSETVLSLLSSKARNPDFLNTLATIFHGPERKVIKFPPSSPMMEVGNGRDVEEANCARALYYQYLTTNPQLWADIVTHADTVALKEVALAAINCLHSTITANWMSETELVSVAASLRPASEGFMAVIMPPAGQSVIPYLGSSPKTFSNLVGGHDVESAAYQIAMAKHDCQRAMHTRLLTLSEEQRSSDITLIIGQIGQRLASGPMSREGEVGGRIGTLEM